MLKNLYIHNYAIIDEISIDFLPHLIVITGETGAGKSILMGALSLILGERADTSVLLDRERKCVVEGNFSTDNRKELLAVLKDNDIENEQGSADIVIRREIAANGKSRAFVNDIPVNLDLLRQVSSLLVDLHRQFDTLSLSDSGFQLNVIDALAGSGSLLPGYKDAFDQWKNARRALDELTERKNSFNKEYDYQKFLFDELHDAGFSENELEEADAEIKLLSHSESIKSALEHAGDALSGGDQPLVHQLKSIQHQLEPYTKYHPGVDDIVKRLHSAQVEIKDVAEEVARISDEVAYNPERIEKLNERISTGYKLLKKHGVQTTAQLLDIYKELDDKLQQVLGIDDEIVAKQKEADKCFATVEEMATRISEKRHKQIKPLQEKVNALLVQVGMPNARLKVEIVPKGYDIYGKDSVEFLFDANKSNRFEPVRKVASGGELSRLMLSIKSLVAESMDMPTLIFDEIDTGISGEAARQVGLIMSGMALKRQLITITHQPQIAGKADSHLFVYKDIVKDKVRTAIRPLTGDERITAIAKMLSGEKPTAAALANAREMIRN